MVVRETRRSPLHQPRSDLFGLLNIDKPIKWTSHDVVAKLRRVLGVKKLGHTGTLDPMATGVLVLCVGRATKMARFLMGLDKEYLATMRLGGESDTLDAEGRIRISEDFPDVSSEDLHRICSNFIGIQDQIPPMFSAVKYKGQPLYKLARRGETVVRQAKQINIRSLEICHYQPPRVTFRVTCSSGTYVRVLAADIGKQLGCGAYLLELRRTLLGPFRCQDALTLDLAVRLAGLGQLGESILPVSQGLERYPRLVVHSRAISRVITGQLLTKESFREVDCGIKKGDEVRIEDPDGKILAMAQMLIQSDQFSMFAHTDLICKSLRVLS